MTTFSMRESSCNCYWEWSYQSRLIGQQDCSSYVEQQGWVWNDSEDDEGKEEQNVISTVECFVLDVETLKDVSGVQEDGGAFIDHD